MLAIFYILTLIASLIMIEEEAEEQTFSDSTIESSIQAGHQ